jgi:hypothetical protein
MIPKFTEKQARDEALMLLRSSASSITRSIAAEKKIATSAVTEVRRADSLARSYNLERTSAHFQRAIDLLVAEPLMEVK